MLERISGFIERLIEGSRVPIVLLLLLFTAAGTMLGYKYHRYSKYDPHFCASCHMMQESYRDWEMSMHRDVICQTCHRINAVEQNRLLVAYVTKGSDGTVFQKHGRVEPWRPCRECHIDAAKQGSVSVRNSFGHAKHVFMHEIDCSRCHTGIRHDFSPDERACSGCHTDKLVHGMGMEGFTCLRCHSYGSETPGLVSSERCLGCHGKIPTTGTMSALKCFDCHHPHGEIKPRNIDCLQNCHGNESTVGQHGLHLRKAGVDCLDCHKAHTWKVGARQAKGLCDRCHPFKDPRSFIY